VLHRLDGPAVKWVNGDAEYYIEGVEYTKEEFEKKVNELKMKTTKYDIIVETRNDKGELHSFNDKHAFERQGFGDKRWYKENKLHRLEGPAVEWCNGDKEWYKEDERHRLDGPAIDYSDGRKFWYIEGERYTKEEFENKINKTITNNKISQDFNSASYRVAANQFSKIVKRSIVSLLEKEGLENTKINNIKNVLDSEIGTVLVGMSIGYLLSIDKFKSNDKLTKLAREFRVESTALIGNTFVDNIVKYIIPNITKEVSKCRIEQNNYDEFENSNNKIESLC